jgi:ATP synthase protein I
LVFHVASPRNIDGKPRRQLQSTGLLDAKKPSTMIRIQSKPLRTVLLWQLMATAALAVVAGLISGEHGAISAALGGGVSLLAGLGFAAVIQWLGRDKSAGGTLVTALQAEGVKIGLAVTLLWVVLASYKDVVAPACVGSFIVTILIFSMAFFVRDNGNR